MNVLEEAAHIVKGPRQEAYGPPGPNHQCTADMFSAYLERKYGWTRTELDAEDVCWFNILQKISREAHQPSRDNLVDIAGYILNVERIQATDRVRGKK